MIVLCLFDGQACREVWQSVRGALSRDVLVVNTSTIAPDEADDLSRLVLAAGHRYLHAPMLGSVPAVSTGLLTVLAGGPADDLETARPLLAVVASEIRLVESAGKAAALKLVANCALAGSLVSLRDVLSVSQAMNLHLSEALEVLALGPLGSVTRAKRSRIDGGQGMHPADFTVAALSKDTTLATEVSGITTTFARDLSLLLATGRVNSDDDIAALCVPTRDRADTSRSTPHSDVGPVLVPLARYVDGHATGDPRHFREAFWPTAHIEGLRDGTFVSWSLEQYCANFTGEPAPTESAHRRTVDSVRVTESIATAAMTLDHMPARFTDTFLLMRMAGEWRIANKVYHRH